MNRLAVFWFRRDLRLSDNKGLFYALSENHEVIPVFIFDKDILSLFPVNDKRISFIYDELNKLNAELSVIGKAIKVFYEKPEEVFAELIEEYEISAVYCNEDYEQAAINREKRVENVLKTKGIHLIHYTDQIIMEPGSVLTGSELPYTVYTPFSRKFKTLLKTDDLKHYRSEDLLEKLVDLPSNKIQYPEGKTYTSYQVAEAKFNENIIRDYHKYRDFPALNACSGLGVHFRFGTISIREAVKNAQKWSETWLKELIWREFFMHILALFPHVEKHSFRKEYDLFPWLNNEEEFKRWKNGETGYPIVDAGMRELNTSGHMHNRVRMITAGFLTKHLLIDWRWGEAYFAEKLMDFELSSNNGNWQWAAGTGCDAAPYFRIFNPTEQAKKFDSESEYILKYVPEVRTNTYVKPLVEHNFARNRCLETFKKFRNQNLLANQ